MEKTTDPATSAAGMAVGGTKAPAVKKGTVRVPSASKKMPPNSFSVKAK